MADLVWNSIYSLQNEEIDKQHKQIFALAAKLKHYKDDDQQLKIAVKDVIEYTRYHFESEEQYMQEIGYEDFAAHKQKHKAIIQKLHKFLASINTLTNKQITQGLFGFLQDNIINHILIEDKKLQYATKTLPQLRQLFNWKNSYKIGNETLDIEHQQLFWLAIKAINYSQNKGTKLKVKETIKELYTYILQHFKHEEEYMQAIKYKEYERHKQIHDTIINQMNIFIQTLPQMKQESFEKKLIEYMDIWLVSHIIIEDKKIAQFAVQRKYLS